MEKKLAKIEFACLGLMAVVIPQPVFADDGLTSLFQTRAFSGSMETISKLNWVGWLLSGIISVFCLIGLFLTIFRIMTSLMYLSGRNVFDKIHEIKTANTGKAFGLTALVKSAYSGSNGSGSGVDAIIYFILGLFPDVRMYSDFAEGAEGKGLGPDTTVTEYILKTSIPTIMMIFFLSIGYSGTLWQMYGTFVDAMAVAAEKVANTNLAPQVNRLLNADSYYQFGFSADGTNWGKKQDTIAKDMYNKVLSKSDSSINGDYSLALGQVIGDQFTNGKLTKKNIAIACGNAEWAEDDLEAKNVQSKVIVNSIKDSSGAHDIVIGFDDLKKNMKGVKDNNAAAKLTTGKDTGLYLHVYVYRKGSAIQTNYFTTKSNGKEATSTTDGKGTMVNPLEQK